MDRSVSPTSSTISVRSTPPQSPSPPPYVMNDNLETTYIDSSPNYSPASPTYSPSNSQYWNERPTSPIITIPAYENLARTDDEQNENCQCQSCNPSSTLQETVTRSNHRSSNPLPYSIQPTPQRAFVYHYTNPLRTEIHYLPCTCLMCQNFDFSGGYV